MEIFNFITSTWRRAMGHISQWSDRIIRRWRKRSFTQNERVPPKVIVIHQMRQMGFSAKEF